jgi:hypothetical protein
MRKKKRKYHLVLLIGVGIILTFGMFIGISFKLNCLNTQQHDLSSKDQNMRFSKNQPLDSHRYSSPQNHLFPEFSISSYQFENFSEEIRTKIWRDYVQYHQRVLEGRYYLEAQKNFPLHSLASYDLSAKYLVFRPAESGWGNRFQMLSFAFQVALVTSRVFLVDWILPCNISELLETPVINWYLDQALSKSSGWNMSYHNSRVELQFDTATQIASFFQNEAIHQLLEPWQFVVISHWSTYETYLAKNEWYSKILKSFFHPNPIQIVSQFLIKPHPTIQKEIEDFKQMHDLKNREVIALQIRRGTKETSFVEIVNLNMEKQFWICAKKFQKSNQTKFFLATDDHTTRERAKLPENMGNRVVFSTKPIVHSGMQQDVDTQGNKRTLEGLRAVVFDFWMLGEFDKVLISDYSSFSRVAAQRTNKNVTVISETTKC